MVYVLLFHVYYRIYRCNIRICYVHCSYPGLMSAEPTCPRGVFDVGHLLNTVHLRTFIKRRLSSVYHVQDHNIISAKGSFLAWKRKDCLRRIFEAIIANCPSLLYWMTSMASALDTDKFYIYIDTRAWLSYRYNYI